MTRLTYGEVDVLQILLEDAFQSLKKAQGYRDALVVFDWENEVRNLTEKTRRLSASFQGLLAYMRSMELDAIPSDLALEVVGRLRDTIRGKRK